MVARTSKVWFVVLIGLIALGLASFWAPFNAHGQLPQGRENQVPQLLSQLEAQLLQIQDLLTSAESSVINQLQAAIDPNADGTAADGPLKQSFQVALLAAGAAGELNDFCGKATVDVLQQKQVKIDLDVVLDLLDQVTVQSLLTSERSLESTLLSFNDGRTHFQAAATRACQFAPQANADVFPGTDDTLFDLSDPDATVDGQSFSLLWSGRSFPYEIELDVLANDRDENLIDPDLALDPADALFIDDAGFGSFDLLGTVDIIDGGTRLRYTSPDPSVAFTGQDTFLYRVCDSAGLCDETQVTIRINESNQPPNGFDDVYPDPFDPASNPILQDTHFVADEFESVLLNDDDPEGNGLFVTGVGPFETLITRTSATFLEPNSDEVCCQSDTAQGGRVVMLSNGSFEYDPPFNYFGPDEFYYELSDEFGGTSIARVELTVLPVNRAPSATEDFYEVTENGFDRASGVGITAVRAVLDVVETDINFCGSFTPCGVLANDTDPEQDQLEASILIDPIHGTLNLNTDGTFTYTSNDNLFGNDLNPSPILDTFTYEVCDLGRIYPDPFNQTSFIQDTVKCDDQEVEIRILPLPRSDVEVEVLRITPVTEFNIGTNTETLNAAAEGTTGNLDAATVIAGTTMDVELNISWNGSDPDDLRLNLVNDLPSGVEVIGVSPASISCDQLNQSISNCLIPLNENPIFQIQVAPDYVRNSSTDIPLGPFEVFMGGDTRVDPVVNANGTNESASASVQVGEQAQVLVESSMPVFDPSFGTGIAGLPLDWQVTIKNFGPSDARGVSLKEGPDAFTSLGYQTQACEVLGQTSGFDQPCPAVDIPMQDIGTFGEVLANYTVDVFSDFVSDSGFGINCDTSPPRCDLEIVFMAEPTSFDPTPANLSDPGIADIHTRVDFVIDIIRIDPTAGGFNDAWPRGDRKPIHVELTNNGPSDAQDVVLSVSLFQGDPSSLYFDASPNSFDTSPLFSLPAGVSDTITTEDITISQDAVSADGPSRSASLGDEFNVFVEVLSDDPDLNSRTEGTYERIRLNGIRIITEANVDLQEHGLGWVDLTGRNDAVDLGLGVENDGPSNLDTLYEIELLIGIIHEDEDGDAVEVEVDDIEVESGYGNFDCATGLFDPGGSGLDLVPFGTTVLQCTGLSLNAGDEETGVIRYRSRDFEGTIQYVGGAIIRSASTNSNASQSIDPRVDDFVWAEDIDFTITCTDSDCSNLGFFSVQDDSEQTPPSLTIRSNDVLDDIVPLTSPYLEVVGMVSQSQAKANALDELFQAQAPLTKTKSIKKPRQVSFRRTQRDLVQDEREPLERVLLFDAIPQDNIGVCTEAINDISEGRQDVDEGWGGLLTHVETQASTLDGTLTTLINAVGAARNLSNRLRVAVGRSGQAATALNDIFFGLDDVNISIQQAQTRLNSDILRRLGEVKTRMNAVTPATTLTQLEATEQINQMMTDMDRIAQDLLRLLQDLKSAQDKLSELRAALQTQTGQSTVSLLRESGFSNAPLMVGWGPADAFSGNDDVRPDSDALATWLEPDNSDGTIQVRVGVRNRGLGTIPAGTRVTLNGLAGADQDGASVDPGALSLELPEIGAGQIVAVPFETNIAYSGYSGTITAQLSAANQTPESQSKEIARCDTPYRQVNNPSIDLSPGPRASSERTFQFVEVPGLGDVPHLWRVYAADDAIDFTAQATYPNRGQLLNEIQEETDRFRILCRQPINYQWVIRKAEPLQKQDELFDSVSAGQLAGKAINRTFNKGALYRVQAKTVMVQEVTISGEQAVTGLFPLTTSQDEFLVIPRPNLRVERITVGPTGSSITGWQEAELLPSRFSLDSPIDMDLTAHVVNLDILGLGDIPAAKDLLEISTAPIDLKVDGSSVGTGQARNVPLVPVAPGPNGKPTPTRSDVAPATVSWSGTEGERTISAQADAANAIDELVEADNEAELSCVSYWSLERGNSVGSRFIEYGPAGVVVRESDRNTILSIKRQPPEGYELSVAAVLRFVPKTGSVQLNQACPIALRNIWDFGDGSPVVNLGTQKLPGFGTLDNTLGEFGTTLGLSVRHRYEEGAFAPTMTSFLGDGSSKVVFETRGRTLEVTNKPIILEVKPSAVGVFLTAIAGLPGYSNEVGLEIEWNGNTPQSVEYTANWLSGNERVQLVPDPSKPLIEYDMSDLRLTKDKVRNLLSFKAVGIDPDNGQQIVDVDSSRMKPTTHEFLAGRPLESLVTSNTIATNTTDREPNEPTRIEQSERLAPTPIEPDRENPFSRRTVTDQGVMQQLASGVTPMQWQTSLPVSTGDALDATVTVSDIEPWHDFVSQAPNADLATTGPRRELTEAEAKEADIMLGNLAESEEFHQLIEHAPLIESTASELVGQIQDKVLAAFEDADESVYRDWHQIQTRLDGALKGTRFVIPQERGPTLTIPGEMVSSALQSNAKRQFGTQSGDRLNNPLYRAVLQQGGSELSIHFPRLQEGIDGRVSVVGEDIQCPPTCMVEVANGAEVVLQAESVNGSVFESWEDCAPVANDPAMCRVSVSRDIIVSAAFRNPRLTVTKNGSGQVASQDNSELNCGLDCEQAYANGTSVLLSAFPASGFYFAGWTDCIDSEGDQCIVQVNRDVVVEAIFLPNPQLTVVKAGNGTGFVGSDLMNGNALAFDCGSICVAAGDIRSVWQLTPSPEPGSIFSEWQGCDDVVDEVCRVTLDGSKSVTATFVMGHTLTIAPEGPGEGRVISQPSGIECGYGSGFGDDCENGFADQTQVTLEALPEPNSTFAGWVNCADVDGVCTVSVDQDITLVPRFERVPRTFEIGGNGDGEGSVSITIDGTTTVCNYASGTIDACNFSVDDGTQVEVDALANDQNSLFTGWAGTNCPYAQAQLMVTIDENIHCIVVFENIDTVTPLLLVSVDGPGNVTTVDDQNQPTMDIDCSMGNCTQRYTAGTQVRLQAQADPDKVFLGWDGDGQCTGQSEIITITVDQGFNCSAAFAGFANLNLSLTVNDTTDLTDDQLPTVSYETSTTDGVCEVGATCTVRAIEGTQVTLKALPDNFFVFNSSWTNCIEGTTSQADSDQGVASTCVVTLDQDERVTASFIRRFINVEVEINETPQVLNVPDPATEFQERGTKGGTGIITGDGTNINCRKKSEQDAATSICTHTMMAGGPVSLTATANDGSIVSRSAADTPSISFFSKDPATGQFQDTTDTAIQCDDFTLTMQATTCNLTVNDDLKVRFAFSLAGGSGPSGSGGNNPAGGALKAQAEAEASLINRTRVRDNALEELDKAQAELIRLRNDPNATPMDIENAEKIRDDAQEKFDKAQADVEAAETKRRETEIALQTIEVQRRESRVDSAEAALEKAAQAKSEALDNLRMLNENGAPQDEIDQAIEALRQAEAEVEKQRAKLQEEQQKLKAEVEARAANEEALATQQRANIQNDQNEADAGVADAEMEVNAAIRNQAAAEAAKQAAENMLPELEETRDDLELDRTQQSTEVDLLELQKIDIENDIEALEMRLAGLDDDDPQRPQLEAELAALNQMKADKEAELDQARTRLAELDEQLNEANRRLEETQAEIEEQERNIRDAVGDQQEAEEELQRNRLRAAELQEQAAEAAQREAEARRQAALAAETEAALNSQTPDNELERLRNERLAAEEDLAEALQQKWEAIRTQRDIAAAEGNDAEVDLLNAKLIKTESEQDIADERKIRDNNAVDLQRQRHVVDDQEERARNNLINDPDDPDLDFDELEESRRRQQGLSDDVDASDNDIEENRRRLAEQAAEVDNLDENSKDTPSFSIGLDFSAVFDKTARTWLIDASASLGGSQSFGDSKPPDKIKNPKNADISGGNDQEKKPGVSASFSIGFSWNTADASGDLSGKVSVSFSFPISKEPAISVSGSISFTTAWLMAGLFKNDGTSIGLGLSLSFSVEIPICPASCLGFPIPISAEISGSFAYGLSISYDKCCPFGRGEGGIKSKSGSLSVDAELYAVIDLGLLRGGPYGGGGVTFTKSSGSRFKFKCARGKVGVRVEINLFVFSGTYELEITWKLGSCSPESNILLDEPGQFRVNTDRPYAGPGYAKFINALQEINQFGVTDTRLIENAFPGSDPQLVTNGETFLLIWVQDDVSQPMLEGQELWYAISDPDLVFSEPQRLTNDAVPDAVPQAAFDSEGNVVVLWSRNREPDLIQSMDIHDIARSFEATSERQFTLEAKESLGQSVNAVVQQTEGPTFMDALAAQELAFAVFDTNNQTWSEPQFLTSNDILDENPMLILDSNGEVRAVWAENPSNLPYPLNEGLPEPASLHTASWDAASQSFGETQLLREFDRASERSVAAHNSQLLYAWIENDQAFAAFFNDGQLGEVTRLAEGLNNAPAAAFTPEGVPLVVWLNKAQVDDDVQQGGLAAELMEAKFENGQWVMQPQLLQGTSINSFELVQDAQGTLALIWGQLSQTRERGVDLFSMSYDHNGNGWTDKKQLTDRALIETALSPVLVGRDVVMAYMAQELSFEDQTLLYSGPDSENPSIIYKDEPYVVPNVPIFGASHLHVLRAGLLADLVIPAESVRLTPEVPAMGETVSIELEVHNIGRLGVDDAESFTVELREGLNGTVIDSQQVPALMVDEFATINFEWTLPGTPDEYILYAVVDPENRVSESPLDNNATAIPVLTHDWAVDSIQFEYEQAGLTSEALSSMIEKASGTMTQDEVVDMALEEEQRQVRIFARISNEGVHPAPGGLVRFEVADLVRATPGIDIPEIRSTISKQPVPALAPGESVLVETLWITEDVVSDDFRLFAAVIADPATETFEVDQSNNELKVALRRAAELQVRAEQLNEGELTVTLFNTGDLDAVAPVVQIYTLNAQGEVGDLLLSLASPEIEAFALIDAFEGTTTVTVPFPADGIGEVLLIVDPENLIQELDEANNTDRVMLLN